MKKFFCIFLVLSLCFSLLALGVSASPVPSSLASTNWSINSNLVIDFFPSPGPDTFYYASISVVNTPLVLSGLVLTSRATNPATLSFIIGNSTYRVCSYSSSTNSTSTYSITIDGVTYPFSTLRNISFPSDAPDNTNILTFLSGNASWTNAPFEAADEGVTNAVSFLGEVVSFCSSNSLALVAIGLSIGLLFVVPFTIRKFKQFVKGY